MNTTISPQIRILAVVGLLAAVGLGASLLVFGHGSSKTAEPAATTHATPRSSTQTTAAHTTPRSHSTPAKAAQAARAAKHATKTHVAARPHAKKAKPVGFRGNRVYATLPQPLQWALAHHKVVVVSLYNPSSDVDAISVAEAHAGAIDAGAGFLLVSVLDNKVAGILTALLPGGGLLPDPGVLVYRAPGDIAVRLDGFADRASVAQAATNVISGLTGPVANAAAAPATTATP
jgi:uncharacterized protein (UPF0333 family)